VVEGTSPERQQESTGLKEIDLSRLKIWIARSSLISVAPAIEFTSRFARTIILSRILVPDEFGTAVAINVVLGTAQLVTDVALDKFAMVNDAGSESLAAAHVLSLARGVLVALALAAAAPALATLFGVPQFSGSFAVAALVPFVGSFSHIGIRQVQRNYDYAPEAIAFLFSNFAAILGLLLALFAFGDHRAIIVSFLTESVVYTVATHLLARSPFQLRARRPTLRAALVFGVPLMINGIGLAVMAQVDRALVGHWFGVTKLASYAVILSISVVPLSMISRVFGSLALSYLLAAKASGQIRARSYHFLLFSFGILATVYSLLVAATLDAITPFVFGKQYTVDPGVHVLITMIVFLRLQCAGAPTMLLLATGRTGELAMINLSRATGLVCACVFEFFLPSFKLVLFGFLIGDFIGLILFFCVSSARASWSRSGSTVDFGAALAAAFVIAGIVYLRPDFTWEDRETVLCVGLLAIAIQVLVGIRKGGPLRAFLRHSRR
jgi:O-antigen/teichoic acid export membrane protein